MIHKILEKTRNYFFYAVDAYDKDDNLKYLFGRKSKLDKCFVKNVPINVIDNVLTIICESFDIPINQKYCLRLDDNLMDIYDSFDYVNGDHCEFERLTDNILNYIYPALSINFEIKTVGDLINEINKTKH